MLFKDFQLCFFWGEIPIVIKASLADCHNMFAIKQINGFFKIGLPNIVGNMRMEPHRRTQIRRIWCRKIRGFYISLEIGSR